MFDHCSSDLHFNHANILKYCPRPYQDINHMNWGLVENWNSVVAPEQTVLVLGDCLMGKITEGFRFLSKLNGKKILISGNHDVKALKYEEFRSNFVEIHERLEIPVKVAGQDVTLVCRHYPPGEQELVTDGTQYFLFGHRHNNVLFDPTLPCLDVGVDAQNYFPISKADILKKVADYLDYLKSENKR